MAHPTDDLLHHLADLEAIRDLARKYCHYVWQRDPDAVAGLFAVDGGFIALDRSIETRGREALRQTFQGGPLGSPGPYPFVHNHVVELAGDRATGVCYLDGRTLLPHGEINLYGGVYEDDYVRVLDRWYFQERRFTLLIPDGIIYAPPAPGDAVV